MFDFLLNLFRKPRPGGVKDQPDARDLRYEEIFGGADSSLPDYFELPINQPIKNQGNTSSCGCQASSLVLGMQLKKELSARYAFYIIKTDDGYESSALSWGQYTRDAAKITKDGICHEDYFVETKTFSDKAYLSDQPSQRAFNNALENKSDAYIRVDGIFGNDFELVKRFIFEQKRPVIIAMPWYDSYNEAKKTGVLPTPRGSEVGHIVTCIGWRGYNYILVNSYGDSWGNDGKFEASRTTPTYDVWGIITNNEIVIPPKEPQRNIGLEQIKAKEMQMELYKRFALYDKARAVAGKEWLLIVQALSYRNYSYEDIVNYCYAKSRNKNIPFNLINFR